MKRLCLLFMGVLFWNVIAFGQAITITVADIASIGDVMDQRSDTIPIPGPGSAGASQTWDLSNLGSDVTKAISAVDPLTLPCGNRFTLANIALSEPDLLTNYFFSKTASGIANVGFTMDYLENGDTVCVIMTTPDTMVTFPSTYNTSFVSNAFGDTKSHIDFVWSVFQVDSARIKHIVHKSSVIDGWGTLILPNGSLPALRQCMHQTTIDTAWAYVASLGGWQFYTAQFDTIDQFIWWANDIGTAIVKMDFDSSSMSATNVDWLYKSGSGTQPYSGNFDINIFPNPVSNQVSIQTQLPYESGTIYDITGNVVMAFPYLSGQTKTINVNMLSDGIYFLKLLGTGVPPLCQKFTVSH